MSPTNEPPKRGSSTPTPPPPARKTTARNSRSSNRPKAFFWLLGLIALIGVAALGYVATKPKSSSVQVVETADTTNAGPSQGYLIGKVDAPVKIVEFADFECPSCGYWATVTEPDVRTRIINAGLANLTFYDFPLTQHRNTLAASNAAACADEQQKFWPMHDRLFQGQEEWNGEATDVPKAFFKRYATEVGLDVSKWEACFDARKYQKRISANLADGMRRAVGSTPTFIIGNKMYPGARSFDEIKRLVDSTARAGGSPTAGASAPPSSK